MYGYIYKTTNLINGKIYIGQHKALKFQGRRYLGSGSIFRRALEKYGKENFKIELLIECDTLQDLNYWERYYIEKENARDDNIGYNITEGGFGGGAPMSEESKEKIRNFNKDKTLVNDGKVCIKISKENLQEYLDLGYSFGPLPYTRTEEFKNKVKETNTGKIAVYKGEHKTRVDAEDLQKYLDDGYSLGWGGSKGHIWKSVKGEGKYKYMYKNGSFLKVAQSEQQRYLDDGWIYKGPRKNKKRVGNKNYVPTAETIEKLRISHLGHKQTKESIEKTRNAVLGRKNVHKKLCLKLVAINDIPKYLDDGWILGRYSKQDEIKYKQELWNEFIDNLTTYKISINESIIKICKSDTLYKPSFIRDVFNKDFKNEFVTLQTLEVQNEFDHLQEEMPKDQAFEKLKEIHCELLEKDIIRMLENK